MHVALRFTSAMVRILSSARSRIGLSRAEERRRTRKAHPIVCPAPELERSEQRISERNGYEPGVPCWVDHSSPDPASAASFYGELFVWESEDQMPPGGPGQYFSAQLRDKRVAAMGSQQNPEAPPMWNTYVAVESADDAVARVREAGGTAYGEAFDVFTAGRMAVLADPAGAPFCIWQAGEHHGAQLVNEPGALCWNELTTRDADGSKPFYASVFGWRTTAMDMGELEYTLWHAPGAGEPSGEEVIGGMMPMVERRGRPTCLRAGWSTSRSRPPTRRLRDARSSAAESPSPRSTRRRAGRRSSPTRRERCSRSSR
jgi:predicted enzyme related to lactoylglutathione lyase